MLHYYKLLQYSGRFVHRYRLAHVSPDKHDRNYREGGGHLPGSVNVTGCNRYAFTNFPSCCAGCHLGPLAIASIAIFASRLFSMVVATTSLTRPFVSTINLIIQVP